MELSRTCQGKRPAPVAMTTSELSTISEDTLRHDETSVLPTEVDSSMLPTQIIHPSPPHHYQDSSKRVCRRGVQSYLSRQQAQMSINDHQEVNRGSVNVSIPIDENVREEQRQVQPETPLGSLDRTKVSLGDSVKTTDSMKLLQEQWGTLAVMHRVYAAVREGLQPLTMHALLSRAPPPAAGCSRLAVATCFTSILRLKEHGFIGVIKDPATNEIADIRLVGMGVSDQY